MTYTYCGLASGCIGYLDLIHSILRSVGGLKQDQLEGLKEDLAVIAARAKEALYAVEQELAARERAAPVGLRAG